ncbi:AAA family ATPase [Streptomyces sp. NPDC047002]|uniref:AAA family ATPase n=1 Tax=Streptomyces sp. NPDC047002 TaxID=3155475 RepID=UPI0034533702
MNGVRVVLIGGTSHTGKSTVARAVADRLGFECLSTDGLARHPGRPWPTPERTVPPHVDAHYRILTEAQLITSVLDHYRRLWPRIEELVTARALAPADTAGLVLEGSALWPAEVARLTAPHTAAVWLAADEDVLAARIHATSGYERLTPAGRTPVEKFLARTLRYQAAMLDLVRRHALARVDTHRERPAGEAADAVLAAVAAQEGPGAGPR